MTCERCGRTTGKVSLIGLTYMCPECQERYADYSAKEQEMTIPADHVVVACDLDANVPHCFIIHKNDTERDNQKRVEIPKALAYYLKTHSCGSQNMRELIFNQGKRFVQTKIKEALEGE